MTRHVAVIGLFVPALLGAQMLGRSACEDSIPDTALIRAPVYLRPDVSDTVARAFRKPLYFLTQTVAVQLRHQLGGRADSVPRADQAFPWSDALGRVAVVARRNHTWNRPAGVWEMHSGGGLALANAVDSVHAAGDLFDWPDAVKWDSVSFALTLVLNAPTPSGGLEPLHSNVDAFAVFTVPAPRTSEVHVIHQDPPHYPQTARRGIVGGVLLSFIVNQDGHVDPRTIVAEWPAELPRLTGTLAASYNSFVDAAKASVASATFAPRTVAGCPVSSLVKAPFSFCLEGLGCMGDKP